MRKLMIAGLFFMMGFLSLVPASYAEDCKCGVDEDGECLPCK